ncbi:hypothetical protein JL100_022320 [Skermanella mucosa]|uniref:anti-sigma factor family protein n=1 Tax=Skermanella mucosa TaxID=1789672 RepID=UPI00192C8CE0|nr:anti-sigma factor [Skermanella mucosa]UEM19796.1 hypothetical protein JL100_022320 [Skermanella mucosa]
MDDYDDINDLDLHGYIDDRLDPPRRRAVEAYLDQHPDKAEWVRRCRLQSEAMRAIYGPVAEEPLPGRLASVFKSGRPARFPGLVRRMAPLAATLLLGCGLGWSAGEFLPRAEATTPVLRESVSLAHTEAARAIVADHTAPSSELVQRPINWVEQASMVDLQVPDLSRYRFSLMGSQVTATTNRSQAAQLSYRDDQGRRLTLQIQPRLPEPDPEIVTEKRNDVRVAYWADGPLMYVMASDLPRDETLAVAHGLNRSIRKMPPPETEAEFGLAERVRSFFQIRG